MKSWIMIPLILVGLAIVLLVLVAMIRKKTEEVANNLFGTRSLVEGVKMQQQELAKTPKTVSGMTRILEPQIQKDFPEFNWVEFRNKAENLLESAFAAITVSDLTRLQEGSGDFENEIENRIRENQTEHIREVYQAVRIHQTEIAKYEKKQGRCIITLQSAVEHVHYKEQDGKIIEGEKAFPQQTKYNTELMYIQDAGLANLDKSVGVTCPNCGAPVTKLGVKFCEYCGSSVVPVNTQVWKFHHFYEVDYQHV